jgi:hypothetical protein
VDGTAVGGPVTVSGGSASIALDGLTAGQRQVTAHFTGTVAGMPDSADAAPLTQAVARAPLTITAENQAMVAGSPVPALTVRYTGFVHGDGASSLTAPAVASTSATSASGAGTYAIMVSSAASPNYVITYVPGTLTVTAPPLQLTAPPQIKAVGVVASFKGHGLVLTGGEPGAIVQVTVKTTLGKLQAHAAGVKVKGNNSTALTLTGTANAVAKALNAMTLKLGKPHASAKVTLAATVAGHKASGIIKVKG